MDAWLMHRRNAKEIQSPMIFNQDQGTNSCSNGPPVFIFICVIIPNVVVLLFKWVHFVDMAAGRVWART
jgi:hypothetical protein